MANDWSSSTGFSYTIDFVGAAEDVDPTDERIELSRPPSSAEAAAEQAEGEAAAARPVLLFIERKAIWAGEGGLLGATLDLDEQFNLHIKPKEEAGGERRGGAAQKTP
jgi:hypothetical protein